MLCLVGPAGSGKTTLSKLLLEDSQCGNNLELSVSSTTRSPRPDEVDGTSYFFLSQEEFQAKIEKGAFYEWETVHGNYYGTSREAVEGCFSRGNDLLLDIDIKGALNLKRALIDKTVIVFLSPPDKRVQVERIRSRAPMDEIELQRRFETAKNEYRALIEGARGRLVVDYLVINDSLNSSLAAVKSILMAERNRLDRIRSEELNTFLGSFL
jgi:guanylate kinase